MDDRTKKIISKAVIVIHEIYWNGIEENKEYITAIYDELGLTTEERKEIDDYISNNKRELQ